MKRFLTMPGRAVKEIKVACPQCGKALPVRIIELSGTLRYSIVCRNCKARSEVEIRDIPSFREKPQETE